METQRFSQILLGQPPRWPQSKTQEFKLSAAQSVDHSSINIYETFGRKKIAVSLLNLVSASVPCSETGSRTLLFIDSRL